jgi:hypothetical protein
MRGEDSLARADPGRHILARAPHPQGLCREMQQALVPLSTDDDVVPGRLPKLASPALPPPGPPRSASRPPVCVASPTSR